MEGQLWIKFNIGDQEAMRLDRSEDYDCVLCGEIVEPVDIEITWRRK